MSSGSLDKTSQCGAMPNPAPPLVRGPIDTQHTEGTRKNTAAVDWLVGGGEMGKLVRAKDWTSTPLGPIDSWPPSLRTTVSLCPGLPISPSPWPGDRTMCRFTTMATGRSARQTPASMGQNLCECWASACPVIGEAFAARVSRQTSYLETSACSWIAWLPRRNVFHLFVQPDS